MPRMHVTRAATAGLAVLVALVCLGWAPAAAGAQEQAGEGGTDRRFPAPRPPARAAEAFFGAILGGPSPGWATVLPYRGTSAGALVLAVVPGSPAASAGIAPGDVVVEIDRVPTMNEESAQVRLRSGPSLQRVVVLARPDGRVRRVAVQLTNAPKVTSAEYLRRRLAGERDPVSRFLVAQTTGDPRIGLGLATDLVRTNPDLAPAHTALALRLLEEAVLGSPQAGVLPQEQLAAVQAAISRALELDPGSSSVHVTAARIALVSGDAPRAGAEAARAVELDGASARAHLLLGQTQLLAGRSAEALPHLHRATALDPYRPEHYRFLAQAYEQVGRHGDARRTEAALDELVRPGGVGLRRQRVGHALAAAAAVLMGVALSLVVPRARAALGIAASEEGDGGSWPPPWPGARPSARLVGAVEVVGALGLCIMAVPYVAPHFSLVLEAPEKLHLADHVLPGAMLAGVAGISLRTLFRAGRLPMFAANAFFLAGLWTAATHLGLLAGALARTTPLAPAVVHSVPGIAVVLVSIWLYRAGEPEIVAEAAT